MKNFLRLVKEVEDGEYTLVQIITCWRGLKSKARGPTSVAYGGSGETLTPKEAEQITTQLCIDGYLKETPKSNGFASHIQTSSSVSLSDKARGFLKYNTQSYIIKTVVDDQSRRRVDVKEDSAVDKRPDLANALQQYRMEIAQASNGRTAELNVFGDDTLELFCARLPTTIEDLRQISGFGDVKIEK